MSSSRATPISSKREAPSAPSSKPHPLWLAANLPPPASSVAPVPSAQGLPASLADSVFATRSGDGLQDGALVPRGAEMAKAQFKLEGDVGEIVIADPPLNLFGLELSRDLASAAGEARDSAARAIVVRAEGDNFSAGANVEM